MINLNLSRIELLVIASIIMSGIGMYYASLVVEPVKKIVEEDIKSGQQRVEQLKILTNLSNTALKQNDAILDVQNAQGNVSEAARARIITNMEVILPAVNQTLTDINKTLIDIETAAPQSNFTAQKIATERIENITRDVALIVKAVNATQ